MEANLRRPCKSVRWREVGSQGACFRDISNAYFVRRFLDPDSFVNAIAPKEDLSRIGRAQFAILFRVADASRRGLLSWTDFTVFQTLLKRPDADYWMAFQYFDVYAFRSNDPKLTGLCSAWLGIIPVSSLMTSSRVSSALTSGPMPFLSILTGKQLPVPDVCGGNSYFFQRLGQIVSWQKEWGTCSRLFVPSSLFLEILGS